MGDKVDNIPGVPGVGEKTATALLQGLGGLDTLYANLDDIAPLGFRGSKTMAKKLLDNKEAAYMSYKLATIKLDVELELAPEQLCKGVPDTDALTELFGKLQFRRWLTEMLDGSDGRIVADESAATTTTEPKVVAPTIDRSGYETVLDEVSFNNWVAQLKNADVFAFDTETDGLDYMTAN